MKEGYSIQPGEIIGRPQEQKGGNEGSPRQIRDDHHPAPIPAVDQRAGEEAEEKLWQREGEEHSPEGAGGIARLCEQAVDPHS
jgi:hypothetical protein